MSGHVAMAGRAARLFFFSFYFIVCLVVVTVVTAEVIISASRVVGLVGRNATDSSPTPRPAC